MQWQDVRKNYPDQWVIIEGMDTHSTSDGKRRFDRLTVIETCPDGASAMRQYREFHKQYPTRKFYFIHTSHEKLDIREKIWPGIRIRPKSEAWIMSLRSMEFQV